MSNTKDAPGVILTSAANWSRWELAFEGLCLRKKCYQPFTSEEENERRLARNEELRTQAEEASDEETADALLAQIQGPVTADPEQQAQAYGYLIQSVHQKLWHIFRRTRDPVIAKQLLHDRLFQRCGTTVGILRLRMSSLVHGARDPIDDLINKIDEISEELDAQGYPCTDEDKVAAIQNALAECPDYEAITDDIDKDTANGDEPNYESVCQRLRMIEQRIKNRRSMARRHGDRPAGNNERRDDNRRRDSSTRGERAYFGTDKNKKNFVPRTPCPHCKQPGHWGRNCPEKKTDKPAKMECYVCGRDHPAARCPDSYKNRQAKNESM